MPAEPLCEFARWGICVENARPIMLVTVALLPRIRGDATGSDALACRIGDGLFASSDPSGRPLEYSVRSSVSSPNFTSDAGVASGSKRGGRLPSLLEVDTVREERRDEGLSCSEPWLVLERLSGERAGPSSSLVAAACAR